MVVNNRHNTVLSGAAVGLKLHLDVQTSIDPHLILTGFRASVRFKRSVCQICRSESETSAVLANFYNFLKPSIRQSFMKLRCFCRSFTMRRIK